jgi:outer membrane protein OmpA-like peptidoglycan-associated protein
MLVAAAAAGAAVPQAARAQSCVAGPFMVFFDYNSATLTPQAAAELDRVAEAYAACGSPNVLIDGHTDSLASAEYNIGLSQRMADNVLAYLANKGIPSTQMITAAYGEHRLLVQTPDGVREPQNRRVEINFAYYGGGW